jgi:hypothetical protein
MKRIILIILSASVINGCSSQQTNHQTQTNQWTNQQTEFLPCTIIALEEEKVNDLVYLKSSNCFRIGAIGVGATSAPEGIALQKVMEQDNAVDSLLDLFDNGSQTGKLYALLGLRFLNHTSFDEFATQLKNRSDSLIETAAGCSSYQTTVGDIIKSIEDGEYDSY